MTVATNDISNLIENNKAWAEGIKSKEPKLFDSIATQQHPEYLWIGCSDSRVPANELLGLGPGQLFVTRNIGNLATHKDLNCMSVMEYSITHLKVKHVLVCGHYNCGAVKASLVWKPSTPGLVNCWISDVRQCRDAHAASLKGLGDDAAWAKLVELNAISQVFNVCTAPMVQDAWAKGQTLAVHGVVFDPATGLLKVLTPPISGPEDVDKLEASMEEENAHDLAKNLKTHLSFTA